MLSKIAAISVSDDGNRTMISAYTNWLYRNMSCINAGHDDLNGSFLEKDKSLSEEMTENPTYSQLLTKMFHQFQLESMNSQDIFYEISESIHCLPDLIKQVVSHNEQQPGVTVGILPTIKHVEYVYRELLTRGIKSVRIHSKVTEYNEAADPNSTDVDSNGKPKSIE